MAHGGRQFAERGKPLGLHQGFLHAAKLGESAFQRVVGAGDVFLMRGNFAEHSNNSAQRQIAGEERRDHGEKHKADQGIAGVVDGGLEQRMMTAEAVSHLFNPRADFALDRFLVGLRLAEQLHHGGHVRMGAGQAIQPVGGNAVAIIFRADAFKKWMPCSESIAQFAARLDFHELLQLVESLHKAPLTRQDLGGMIAFELFARHSVFDAVDGSQHYEFAVRGNDLAHRGPHLFEAQEMLGEHVVAGTLLAQLGGAGVDEADNREPAQQNRAACYRQVSIWTHRPTAPESLIDDSLARGPLKNDFTSAAADQ